MCVALMHQHHCLILQCFRTITSIIKLETINSIKFLLTATSCFTYWTQSTAGLWQRLWTNCR